MPLVASEMLLIKEQLVCRIVLQNLAMQMTVHM